MAGYEVIMTIPDYISKIEKSEKEKQELIEYLKEKINECKTSQKLYYNHKMDRFAEDEGLKKRIYQEILSKIEKR